MVVDLEETKEKCTKLEKELAAVKKQCLGHCDEFAKFKAEDEKKDVKISQ